MNPADNTIHYRVAAHSVHAHLYAVTLSIPHAIAGTMLALPVWIPGSYLVREFAQHLQHLRAHSDGQPVALLQLDKHRWRVDGPSTAGLLVVTYEVYAFDASVRTAWLDSTRGFFNGTSLCLRVLGREDHPHQLEVLPPEASASLGTTTVPALAQWQLATGLSPVQVDERGFGTYGAASYAELVDEPVEMAPFWSAHFEVRGVPHRLVVSGAGPWLDGERLVADTQRICEAEMAFWHGPTGQPPFSRYVFMVNATHDGYGGLEHPHSTALICPRGDLPRRPLAAAPGAAHPTLTATDGYTRLLGLISHEYFHTWNVKRMRPSEFTQMDLDRENHTELLWFFEGFTSYYDDLLLLRAGLIDTATYLKLLARTINQVAQTPGRLVQTVAQASFDAWTKYYRVQENTPNATVSYYTKGALVALCLDLTLRQHGSSLDHAMRALWQRSHGGPMTERDLRDVVARLAGRALDAELDGWLHSTAELPVPELLAAHGMPVHTEAAPLAQRLGLKVSEQAGITVKAVLRGGLAEQAGMAAGDEWVAVDLGFNDIWRIQALDDVPPLLGQRTQLTAWVSRDRRLLALPLQWPATDGSTPGATVVQLTPPATGAHTASTPAWPAALA
jgi:predicted metalloprotease with PDZ domain